MGKTHIDSLVRFKLFKDYVGEFDPGSGRTLALLNLKLESLISDMLEANSTDMGIF